MNKTHQLSGILLFIGFVVIYFFVVIHISSNIIRSKFTQPFLVRKLCSLSHILSIRSVVPMIIATIKMNAIKAHA